MSVATNPLISGIPTGTDGVPVGYTPISGTTHTWAVGEKLYCTNASGCTITLPSGIAEGEAGLAIQAAGAGAITIATSGSTTIPTGTLATSRVGQIIAWERTETADEYVVNGYTPAGPKYVATYTSWSSLVADYPVGGAAIAALGATDYLVCTINNRIVTFRPNAAKTRLVADGGRIILGEYNTTLTDAGTNNKIGTGVTAITKFPKWASIQLPAYLAQPGDMFIIKAAARKVGTGAACQLDVKLGTADSNADQTIAKVTIANANNQDGYIDQSVGIYDATTLDAIQEVITNSSALSKQNTPTTAVNSLQYAALYIESLNTADYVVGTQLLFELVQSPA